MWRNIILSGDNAVVLGLAAAPSRFIAAAVLRIAFSVFASVLLALRRVDIAGGAALLWIASTFRHELLAGAGEMAGAAEGGVARKTLVAALWQIIVADVSMSLDNVLAMAAVARSDFALLALGFGLSIAMLGGWLARLLDRFRAIAYIGMALIAWIGLELLWEGFLIANGHLDRGLPLPAAPGH